MTVGELKQYLSTQDDSLEVRVATDRYTGPFDHDVLGTVLRTNYGPLYIVTSGVAHMMASDDAWRELDA